MVKYYYEADKLKYVRGFKSCNLTLLEYCDKMEIRYDDMKEWLKEYKNPPTFGKIDVKAITMEKENKSKCPITFENETIKIELYPGYDKKLLLQMVEVLTQC